MIPIKRFWLYGEDGARYQAPNPYLDRTDTSGMHGASSRQGHNPALLAGFAAKDRE